MADKLSLELLSLEAALLSEAIRANPDQLDKLLADDYLEFGSSGKVYDKASTIEGLLKNPAKVLTIHNYHAHPLDADWVLATFETSADDGSYVLRSSIWTRKDGDWQIAFHQGTPARNSNKA